MFTLDHVGQRLQRSVRRTEHGAFTPIVVEECIDRLLQHPLFVTDDDFWRVQINQFFQSIVSIDDTTVEVVQIAGGKVARIKQHKRTQIGRNYGDAIQHHPFGFVIAVAQRFCDLQSLDQLFLLLLTGRLFQFDAELRGQFDEIQAHQELLDRVGTHFNFEGRFTVLRSGLSRFFFGQKLTFTQRRITRVKNDIVLEVHDLFECRCLDVQQCTQSAGHRLKEPDMDDRGGKFNMPHSLPANTTVGHFDSAAVADHPLVLHASVLATRAFPVLFGAENPFAEKSVSLRAVRTVINGLRLFDFAK